MAVFNNKPSRSAALSLFTKARDMMSQVVEHHKSEITRLEGELNFNTSELEASKRSLEALDLVLGKKK